MNLLKQLWFGLILIFVTSAILLIADWGKRHGGNRRSSAIEHKRVAILQLSTRPILDDSRDGIILGLRQSGFIEGENLSIKRYNSEGDLATAANIAKSITDGNFDAVFTISTPALQAMANANKNAKVPHIFCSVTDPYGAGVGISRDNHLDHPDYMTGMGTFQPVDMAFEYALQMNPELKKVGTVWNPSETNSEACVKKARSFCEERGIKLLEALANNSIEVGESANALAARGVDAIWIGGDNVVELATPAIVKVGRDNQIPIFANAPIHAREGCLFGVGADYFHVGIEAGKMGAKVLKGVSPAKISVENFAPPQLALNYSVTEHLSEDWVISDDLQKEAVYYVNKEGQEITNEALNVSYSGNFKVAILNFVSQYVLEQVEQGIIDALKDDGFLSDQHLDLKMFNAEGDFSVLPNMAQSIAQSDFDLVITISTPCLQAFFNANQQSQLKHLFCAVTDPFSAGIGLKEGEPFEHPAWIAGSGSKVDVHGALIRLNQILPQLNTVGTLWNPAESNSEVLTREARKACENLGLKLLENQVEKSFDVAVAAQALIDKGAEAIWIGGDSTVENAMEVLIRTCLKNKVPLACGGYEFCEKGTLMAYGPKTYQIGYYTGEMASAFLNGEKLTESPIVNYAPSNFVLNLKTASSLGLEIPSEIKTNAQLLINEDGSTHLNADESIIHPPATRKHLAYMIYTEAKVCESFEEGFLEQMDEMGWIKDVHYRYQKTSAQGDLSILPTIAKTIAEKSPDVLVTNSTPTLQAVSVEIESIPIIGSVISSPVLAGVAETMEKHRPNITGVHTMSDFEMMLYVISECFPDIKKVGTIYTPSEINSVYYMEEFQRILEQNGIELVTKAAPTSADLTNAAQALANSDIQVLAQISDNSSGAGFAAIAKATERAGMPLFAFVEKQSISDGAAISVSRDFTQCGRDSAKMAARILKGASPANIPYEGVSKTLVTVNLQNAKKYKISVPKTVLDKADRILE